MRQEKCRFFRPDTRQTRDAYPKKEGESSAFNFVSGRSEGTKKKPGRMDSAGLMYEFLGVADGTRTHDDRNHNPGLYQLSYGHH